MPSRGQSGIATVLDWNTSSNVFKTGDAANVELFFIKDGVVTTPANQAAITENSGSAGGPIGAYSIAWTSAEGTCNTLWVGGQSSSANCSIIPITITFEQLPIAAPASSNGLITVGSGVGQLNMASGIGFANVQQWIGLPPSVLIGGLVQATFSGTTPGVNVTQWLGAPPSVLIGGLVQSTFSGTTPAVNVTQIGGAATIGLPGFVGVDWSAIANASAIELLSQTTIAGYSGTSPSVNVTRWLGVAPNALSGGNVQADVEQWRTVQPNTLVSGRVDGIANQIGTNAIGAGARVAGSLVTTAFALDYFTSALLDPTAANAIADALLDRSNAIENGITPRLAWRYIGAAEAAQTSGALTGQFSIVAMGSGNMGSTRIVAQTDSSGNRLAVALT